MTDDRQIPADTRWRTVVGQCLAASASLVAGRIAIGPNFGYVIFLLVWLPVLMGWLAPLSCIQRISGRSLWLMAGAILCTVIGTFLVGWPFGVTLRLTALLLIFSLFTLTWTVLLARWMSPSIATCLVAVAWLTWLAVPVLMANPLQDLIGERFATLFALHPLVACNAADTTAGDWTHQAVAYTHLTRLGQDVAFDWPQSVIPCFTAHGALTVLAAIGSVFVPRGTLRNMRR